MVESFSKLVVGSKMCGISFLSENEVRGYFDAVDELLQSYCYDVPQETLLLVQHCLEALPRMKSESSRLIDEIKRRLLND